MRKAIRLSSHNEPTSARGLRSLLRLASERPSEHNDPHAQIAFADVLDKNYSRFASVTLLH